MLYLILIFKKVIYTLFRLHLILLKVNKIITHYTKLFNSFIIRFQKLLCISLQCYWLSIVNFVLQITYNFLILNNKIVLVMNLFPNMNYRYEPNLANFPTIKQMKKTFWEAIFDIIRTPINKDIVKLVLNFINYYNFKTFATLKI